MTETTAQVVAAMICQLKHLTKAAGLLRRGDGIYHLFARPVEAEPRGSSTPY